MNKGIVVLGSNNVDMLGCCLNIDYKFPSLRREYFFSNYSDIHKVVNEVIEFQKENSFGHLIIADLGLSEHKESLEKLCAYFQNITHVDHHEYPEGYKESFPTVKFLHKKDKSSSLILNEYLGNKGSSRELDALTRIIDTYDLWKYKEDIFNSCIDFNEYFRMYGLKKTYEKIKKSNFWLPSDYKNSISEIIKKREFDIKELEAKGLIKRANKTSIVFSDNWISNLIISEMEKNQELVICGTSYGIIYVRFNPECDISPDVKDSLREMFTGSRFIGSLNAFTFKVNPVNFQTIINTIEIIINKFSGEINESR